MQRFLKKRLNASEAELKNLDQQIQGKETLRIQLLNELKAKMAAQVDKRQRFIQDLKATDIVVPIIIDLA